MVGSSSTINICGTAVLLTLYFFSGLKNGPPLLLPNCVHRTPTASKFFMRSLVTRMANNLSECIDPQTAGAVIPNSGSGQLLRGSVNGNSDKHVKLNRSLKPIIDP
jgi:hypothetical protein